MELFEEMEEKDPHLFSQMQTRKLAVTGLEWEVQPSTKEPEDQAISEFVSEQLTALEGFDAAMFDMLDAIGNGMWMKKGMILSGRWNGSIPKSWYGILKKKS